MVLLGSWTPPTVDGLGGAGGSAFPVLMLVLIDRRNGASVGQSSLLIFSGPTLDAARLSEHHLWLLMFRRPDGKADVALLEENHNMLKDC